MVDNDYGINIEPVPIKNMFALAIDGENGWVLRITAKGRLEINPNVTLEEAEQLFWHLLADDVRRMYESYLPQVLTSND